MHWRNIGPSRAGAPSRRRAIRASPTRFTLASATAASGRPPMRGGPGNRSSTARAQARSDRSSSRRRIRMCSTWVAAKGWAGPTFRSVTGCTSRATAAKTWTHLGLRDGQQIPNIAIDPRNAEPTVCGGRRAPIRPERGARHFSLDRWWPVVSDAYCSRTSTPAATTSTSIRQSRYRLCDLVGRAAGTMGERAVARHGRRYLQVDRRWHHLETVDRGMPRRRITQANVAIAPSNSSGSTRRIARERGHIVLSIG